MIPVLTFQSRGEMELERMAETPVSVQVIELADEAGLVLKDHATQLIWRAVPARFPYTEELLVRGAGGVPFRFDRVLHPLRNCGTAQGEELASNRRRCETRMACMQLVDFLHQVDAG